MSKIQKAKRELLLQNWKQEIEARTASGLTVSQWCRQNNINPKSYYYHLRQVRLAFLEESQSEEERHEIVPISQPQISDCTETKETNIIIRKDDMSIEISENISSQALQRLLKEVKSC